MSKPSSINSMPSQQPYPSVVDKLAKIEHSIAKLEDDINSLNEITVYKDQIPSLIKLQRNIQQTKKKCEAYITSIDVKGDKLDQTTQLFSDSNSNIKKILNEDNQTRLGDASKVSNKIESLEKQVKALLLKNQIELQEKDVRHQEDMIKIATELSMQINGEKEYLLDSINQPYKRFIGFNICDVQMLPTLNQILAPINNAMQEITAELLKIIFEDKDQNSKDAINTFDAAIRETAQNIKEMISERVKFISTINHELSMIIQVEN